MGTVGGIPSPPDYELGLFPNLVMPGSTRHPVRLALWLVGLALTHAALDPGSLEAIADNGVTCEDEAVFGLSRYAT